MLSLKNIKITLLITIIGSFSIAEASDNPLINLLINSDEIKANYKGSNNIPRINPEDAYKGVANVPPPIIDNSNNILSGPKIIDIVTLKNRPSDTEDNQTDDNFNVDNVLSSSDINQILLPPEGSKLSLMENNYPPKRRDFKQTVADVSLVVDPQPISKEEVDKALGEQRVDYGPDHVVYRYTISQIPSVVRNPFRTAEKLLQPVEETTSTGSNLLLLSQVNVAQRGTRTAANITTPPNRPKFAQTATSSASVSPVADIMTDFASGRGSKVSAKRISYKKLGSCVVRNVRDVKQIGNSKFVGYGGSIMNKDLAEKMAEFEKRVLQPAAKKYYGTNVVAMDSFSSFRCSNIAGSRNRSEHSYANAMDIGGFVLSNGKKVSVLKDWHGSRTDRNFLRSLRKGACEIFGTTLTPNYNKAHRDHFHFDAKARRSKNICN